MWPAASETEALLHRIAHRDAVAADELWERHRPALRRMIDLRLDQALARRVDASDVVQDVLLRANQRLADYLRNPSMPFHLWLRQIATRPGHRRPPPAPPGRQADRWTASGRWAARRFADDRSSLDLAAQLRDPSPTPAAEALRRELAVPLPRCPVPISTMTIARSSCSGTSSSSPTARPPGPWA